MSDNVFSALCALYAAIEDAPGDTTCVLKGMNSLADQVEHMESPPEPEEEEDDLYREIPDAGHLEYCRDVVEGRIIAGEIVRLACQRSLDEHQKAATDPEFPFVYRHDFALPLVWFVEACPHTKGSWARRAERFRLAPWQLWIACELYGWRMREDPTIRRYTEGLVEVAKKNGKTALAATMGLYELMYGDAGAEVVSAATTQQQARIVWNAAGDIVERKIPGLTDGVKKLIGEIKFSNCTWRPLSKQAKSLDGQNPSFFIVDEAAAIEDRSIVEAITSGMGSRESAWTIFITTAQSNTSTLYFEKREFAKTMLKGEARMDPRLFAAIYELDAEDDVDKDTKCWVKANPNLGVSVLTHFLEKEVKNSASLPSQRNSVLIKNFNRWVSSAAAWIDGTEWRECTGEVVREGPCWIGADLAKLRDLTAVCRIWANSRDKYSVDFQCWIPEGAMEHVPDRILHYYQHAIDTGILAVTPGRTMDLVAVEDYLRESYEKFDVWTIGVDPWNAQDMTNRLEEERFPILQVNQRMSVLNFPTKKTEDLILNRRIQHAGHPFVQWQLENCHCTPPDINHNVKVRQGVDEHAKVDALIALLTGMACVDYSANPESSSSMEIVTLPMKTAEGVGRHMH